MATRSQTSSSRKQGASKRLDDTNYTDYRVRKPRITYAEIMSLYNNSQSELESEEYESESVAHQSMVGKNSDTGALKRLQECINEALIILTIIICKQGITQQSKKHNQNNPNWSTNPE